MKKLLSNPLLHFVVIGVAAAGLYGLVRGSSVDDSQRIEVGAEDISRLGEMWTAQWKRPPTQGELDGLIDNFIREEILYREALAMGLDRDDIVVRRRMAQKLEFLADDLATRAEPSREELDLFLEENLERYQLPARVSFSHIYFSEDRRGAALESDARDALERVRGGDSPDALGDPFMLQREYPLRTSQEVAQLFGSEFAGAIMAMEPSGWAGPVPSSYGLHLVEIRERAPARRPELADVAARVRNDLLAKRRDEGKQALVDSLKERYEISVVVGR